MGCGFENVTGSLPLGTVALIVRLGCRGPGLAVVGVIVMGWELSVALVQPEMLLFPSRVEELSFVLVVGFLPWVVRAAAEVEKASVGVTPVQHVTCTTQNFETY